MARIIRHDVVDSTSERAFDALKSGTARDGDVHVARGQTRGRGRRGARWFSATGEGLYLSYVHVPAAAPRMPGLLTMSAGLAVLDAVRGLHLRRARLEWPNDVVVDRAKLAGILVEARGYDPVAPRFVVGVGINVAQTSFPEELVAERPVTSLLLAGVSVDQESLLQDVVGGLEQRLERAGSHPDSTCSAYLKATGLEGAEVRVRVGADDHIGLWEALTPGEGILLRLVDGTTLALDPSRVSAVEPTSPFL